MSQQGAVEPAWTRRELLRSAAASAVLAPLAGCAARDDRPNVLLVLADGHRSSALGCYGNDDVRTPAFDAFAAEGLRLTTAVSNTPSCRPYRASLMAGDLACRTGMLGNHTELNFGVRGEQWTPGERPLLGTTFARAGYRCGYVGKLHVGRANVDPGPARFGFDDSWAVAGEDHHEYFRWLYYTDRVTAVRGEGAFRPRMEADLALDFVAAADARPWLLVLSWGPPHRPFTPPAEFTRDEPATPPPNVPVRPNAGRALAGYYGLVEAIDAEFGRLVRALDGTGVGRRTVVVYTSDHGMHAESTQVPFLVRWPGRITTGATLAVPFGAPDVFPTLAGLAGVAVPEGVGGVDVSAAFTGGSLADLPTSAYLSGYVPTTKRPAWRGVRTERWLYARTRAEPWLLFDLEQDPYQVRNLVETHADRRRELDELTERSMQRVGDRWYGA